MNNDVRLRWCAASLFAAAGPFWIGKVTAVSTPENERGTKRCKG